MLHQKLTEYVKHIYELECSIFQNTNLAALIEAKIEELPKTPPTPPKFRLNKLLTLLIFLLGPIPIILLLYVAGFSSGIGIIVLIAVSALLDDSLFLYGIIYFLLGLLCVWVARSNSNTKQKKYLEALEEFHSANEIRRLLKEKLETVRALIAADRSIRDQYYEHPRKNAYNYIYGKYRNFVAITSIYEYLDSKRKNTLPDCYNLYEQEIRSDRIIEQLDIIINQLNQIKANQYLLYHSINDAIHVNQQILHELCDLNLKADQIASNTNKLSEYARMNEYLHEQIESEIRHRNFLSEMDD